MEATFTKRMKRISLMALAMLLLGVQGGVAQNTGDFRSQLSTGDWANIATWERWDGDSWEDAASGQLPTSSSEVFIQQGHAVSVTSTSECKTLSISTDGSQGALTISGTGVSLNIHEKLRGYTGTSTNSSTIGTNSLQTNSDGKLVFVGSSRTILSSSEWNTNANKIDVVINLTATHQLSLSSAFGVRSLTVSNGTLLAGINQIYVEEDVTIGSAGEFASAVSGSPVFSKLGNLTAGDLNIGSGGKLVFFGASPQLNMTNLNFANGTVTYELTGGNQTLITEHNTAIVPYGNLTLKSTANKQIPVGKTLKVNGTLSNEANSAIVLNQGKLEINGDLTGTGTISADNLGTIEIGGTGTLTSDLTFTTGFQELGTLILNRTSTGLVELGSPLVLATNLTLTAGNLITNATTGKLTLKNHLAGSLSGGSATSYVLGPMSRIVDLTLAGPADLTFPIGKGGAYRPVGLTLNQQAGLETYTAEQFNTAPTPRTMATNMTHVSAVRYFKIEKAGSVGLNSAFVKLSFDSDDKVDADPDYLTIAKSNGAFWDDLGRDAGKSSATIFEVPGFITSATSFTTFSDFVLANKSGAWNTLPVELISFDAKLKENQVQLTWVTAAEINNNFFVVERSANGSEFTSIETVKGKGNTAKVSNYVAVDTQPLNGLSYYRLKQVDFDGATSFSKVVTVSAKGLVTPVSVYPNPVTDNLTINLPAVAEKTNVVVSNLLGQSVLTKQLSGNSGNEAVLNVASLPAGTYQVKVTTTTGSYVAKFVKATL